MLKKLMMSFTLFTCFHAPQLLAGNSLEKDHLQAVQAYLKNLNDKDAKAIINLFESNGSVISTSKGKVKAAQFFNHFLPELSQSEVKIKQIYQSISDSNRMGAKFHFAYTMKNGERGEGEYMDDFLFRNNSDKLVQVEMFENLKG
jgi:hypothetical protein